MTRGLPFRSSRILAGLRSRWITPRSMGVVDRLGDLDHQLGRLAGRQRPVGQPLRQALPLDEAHAEVVLALVLADLVDRHDARVVEVGGGLGLDVEAA